MYVIGLLLYVGVVTLYILFDAIKNLVYQAAKLAPEISIVVGIIVLYPLIIFLYHLIFRKRSYSYGRYLSSQAKLSASAAASFGLIGTFQGLTQMVSTISHAMGSDGNNADLVERMNTMINSISSALASMSYAFITSICGVAGSVLVLIALNFFITYYKKEEEKKQPEIQTGRDYTEEINLLLSRLNHLEELNLGVAKKLVGLSDIEEDSGKIISLLTDVKDNLGATLKDIVIHTGNQLEIQQTTATTLSEFSQVLQESQQATAASLNKLSQVLQESQQATAASLNNLSQILQENQQATATGLNEFSQILQENANRNRAELSGAMSEQKQILGLIADNVDQVNGTLEKTFIYTQQLPELIDKHNKVNEALHDMKSDMVNSLQTLGNEIRLIPELLHTQNISTNTLIEAQQVLNLNVGQTNTRLQELIEEQRKSRLSSGKVRKSLQHALEMFADE